MRHPRGEQPHDLIALVHAELPADHLKILRKLFAVAPRRDVERRIVFARQKIARQKRLYDVPNAYAFLFVQQFQLHFLFSLRLSVRLLYRIVSCSRISLCLPS